MVTIVTRSGKGTALTYDEMDANFVNLNTKLEPGSPATDISFVPSGLITSLNVQGAIADAATASKTSNIPAGNIVATNTQDAINELDTEKQVASPILTSITSNTLGAFSFRNVIHNGTFRINQRSYVSGAATTVGQYVFDRWKVTTTAGVTYTTTAGKTICTIPVGQTIQQVVEGVNLLSGTYVLSWEGTAQARINTGAYGDSGTVQATMTGGTNATIEFSQGTVTSVQLEYGTIVTPFELRPLRTEYTLCEWYFRRLSPRIVWSGNTNTGTNYTASVSFPRMRIAPTSSNITTTTTSGFGSVSISGTDVDYVRGSATASSTANGSLYSFGCDLSAEV